MARKLTQTEHDTMISAIRACGMWLVEKRKLTNQTFSAEGCEVILEEGLKNRARMRGDLIKIARGFYFDYQKAHGVDQFIVPIGTEPVVQTPVAEPTVEPVQEPENHTVQTIIAEPEKASGAEGAVNPFIDYVLGTVEPKVEKRVSACEKTMRDTVADLKKKVEEVRKVQYEVTVKRDTSTVTLNEIVHSKFGLVMCYVENNEPVYLSGPAGTGKNVLAEQVAKALGLEFYPMSRITQEYQITGFIDGYGVFHDNQFYKAFTQGGLLFMDEIDSSIPEALNTINGALANRYFDFPVGKIDAHPDFRVIVAGNTCGTGATSVYSARNQLDGATLDRFGMIKIDYDERIEMMCAGEDKELVDFFHQLRKVADDRLDLVLSYRGITRCRKIGNASSKLDAVESGVCKGLDATTIKALADGLSGAKNGWVQAMKELANSL